QIVIPGVSGPRAVVAPKPTAAPAPKPAAKAAAPAPKPAPKPAVVAKPAPVVQAAAKAPASGTSGWGIVSIASRYLGVPYAWGGVSPGGFDCSGLVWYVYQRAGIPIPRDLYGQLQSGTRISRANLLPGDIVFFGNTYQAGLSHDGIYIGGGRFINAVDYGIGVAVSSMNDSYWSAHYYGASRPW
ncbi:MAG TPA: C40 family peptidase, partial [Chloroflexota bacterium]|nr:C40 family peptidase [Chloroflexota bacterium]